VLYFQLITTCKIYLTKYFSIYTIICTRFFAPQYSCRSGISFDYLVRWPRRHRELNIEHYLRLGARSLRTRRFTPCRILPPCRLFSAKRCMVPLHQLCPLCRLRSPDGLHPRRLRPTRKRKAKCSSSNRQLLFTFVIPEYPEMCHCNIAVNTPDTRGCAITSLPQIHQWIYFLRLWIYLLRLSGFILFGLVKLSSSAQWIHLLRLIGFCLRRIHLIRL
jgi:hypothetical protein